MRARARTTETTMEAAAEEDDAKEVGEVEAISRTFLNPSLNNFKC